MPFLSTMATRVVVADESQNVLRSVRVILGQEGCEVTGVSDTKGLDLAIKRVRPHIVLVDAELPPTDGYLAARAVKEDDESSHVSVLLMVGTFVELDREALEASRADGFITKPFDPLALRARVREVLKEMEDTNRVNISDVQAMAATRSTDDVLKEVEALADVPEIAADDFGELGAQDATFPAEEPAAAAAPPPPAEHAPAEHARPAGQKTAPPRLVAFVQKLKEKAAPPEEEALTEEERRIIEANEAVLRGVAEAPVEHEAASSDLSSLVSEAEAPPSVAESATEPPVDEPEVKATWAAEQEPEGASDTAPVIAPPPSEPPPLAADAPAVPGDAEEIVEVEERVFEVEEEAPPSAPPSLEVEPPAAEPAPVPELAAVESEPATTLEAPVPAVPAEPAPAAAAISASDPALVERIVEEVIRRMSDQVVREIAWEVVPELAELLIKRKLQEGVSR